MLSKSNSLINMPLLGINKGIKLFIVIALLIFFYNIPKKYLGDTFPLCLYRIVFDKKCIGCGTTRAIWSILHLKIKEAIEYNKLVVISFPLLIGCTFSWIYKKDKIAALPK